MIYIPKFNLKIYKKYICINLETVISVKPNWHLLVFTLNLVKLSLNIQPNISYQLNLFQINVLSNIGTLHIK